MVSMSITKLVLKTPHATYNTQQSVLLLLPGTCCWLGRAAFRNQSFGLGSGGRELAAPRPPGCLPALPKDADPPLRRAHPHWCFPVSPPLPPPGQDRGPRHCSGLPASWQLSRRAVTVQSLSSSPTVLWVPAGSNYGSFTSALPDRCVMPKMSSGLFDRLVSD